jgi:HPt (histidine-containing phosphotransfer) domain-containing protein
MIDWKHIEQLAADVGPAEMTNIVGLFLDEMDSEIAALTPGVVSGNEGLAAKMHFLKGSAFYLGFTTFGNLCAAFEIQLGTEAAIDLGRLVSVYQQSRNQFLAEAPRHSLVVADA